jgi:putative ATP-binding cassette transporter
VRAQLCVGSPDGRFCDEGIPEVLERVGLAEAVRRVGGVDAEIHSPTAFSPAEQRLLIFARVLLARPRFVFLDRMGVALNQEQLENVYRLLREASISYLSIGDAHRLEAHHDRVLEIRGEGRWEIVAAGEPRGDDGSADERLVADAAGGHP